MRITLPESRLLWEAKTSTEWRDAFLASDANKLSSLPSVRQCIADSSLVLPFRDAVDSQLTSLAILSGLWPSIVNLRQKIQQQSEKAQPNSLIINALYQEAKDNLDNFKLVFTDLWGELAPCVQVLHERLLMSLSVSLEDVQILSGRAGEVEARRTIPTITAWMRSRDSRQALWHAAQLLRVIKRYPDSLPAPSIIAVYHASLVLWAYSVVLSIDESVEPHSTAIQNKSARLACLDGDSDVQHFITLGYGTPVITLHDSSLGDSTARHIPIRDGRAVMTTIVDFLLTRNRVADSRDRAPLVANLGRLMLELGDATGRTSKEALQSMKRPSSRT